MSPICLAWSVTILKITEEDAIVAAPTRGKAMAAALRSAHDAGYPYSLGFTDVVAKRAPEFDRWASGESRGGRLWIREYLERHLLGQEGIEELPEITSPAGYIDGGNGSLVAAGEGALDILAAMPSVTLKILPAGKFRNN